MNSDQVVVALIADVVGSRRITDRDDFNRTLQITLDRLNRDNLTILSPYTLTLGDELQAVFWNAGSLFGDAIALLAALYPYKMRFSYGIGTLVTPINPDQAIGMDGPAFYKARHGIQKLKDSKYALFVVGADNMPRIRLINQTLSLISHTTKTWNQNRWNTLALLYDGMKVAQIADHLALTEQAIYKTINAGALDEIQAIFTEVKAEIDGYLREVTS